MLAESVNHYDVSDLLPDFCGVVAERDRRIVQSDLSGLLGFLEQTEAFVGHLGGGGLW